MGAQNFEQQITFYHNIFVYCGIAALVFLAIAVIIFFVLKIPRVIGEFTGRDAKKAIEEMTAANDITGDLSASRRLGDDGRRHRKARSGGLGTGRLKKNPAHSGGPGQESKQMSVGAAVPNTTASQGMEVGQSMIPGYDDTPTGSQPTDRLVQEQPSYSEQDTYESTPTDVLDSFGSAPTDVLDNFGSAPTDVLNNFSGAPAGMQYQQPVTETMVLDQGKMPMSGGNHGFVILRSIVEIHTEEVI